MSQRQPLLERVGVNYFGRRTRRTAQVEQIDAVHILNPHERAALKGVARGAVFRSFMAGFLSACVSAVAELIANPYLPDGASPLSIGGLKYWAILLGATLVASIAEIAFLYWDTLRSVHELARVAGLRLYGSEEERSAVGEALARAALELPNPVETSDGINPHKESAKWRLVIASLLYKAKVGVSNFLFKMLIRRMLGRVLARAALNNLVPFVAVPITAAWNAVVTWRVLREARIRAMGPSASGELVDLVFSDAPELSEQGRLAAVRAVASSVVRTEDLHPNLLALFGHVQKKAHYTGSQELDDVAGFLTSLKTLIEPERRLALQILAIACIVDGRFSRKERRLYKEALTVAGRDVRLDVVDKLCREFVRGDGWADEAVRAL